MELPQRKINRIPEYNYNQNGAYFITICTQDRKPILSQIVGDGSPVPKTAGLIAEKTIMQITEKYPSVSVEKYVIMPDHIHILLRIDNGTGNPSPTLGNIIGWYKYQVTKEVNRQNYTAGEKLFQRSYYDHVIRNQQDYNAVWEYIEQNPRKRMMQNNGYK